MNYKFCEVRRKGVLAKRDQLRWAKFARDVLNKHSPQLWMDEICFHLDGVSFWYKTNPVAEAKTPCGKIQRKRNKGLYPLCTAKGCHTGSGGKVAKMFVAEKKSSFVNNMKNATGTISPILFVEILENCLGLVERCTRDYLFKTIVPHRIVQRHG